MKFSFLAVIALVALAFLGANLGSGMQYLFGVIIPYVAFFLFIGGFIYRVTQWAKSPVPFSIPTTSGQGKSLPWINHAKLDNPSTIGGVIGRMALEVFAFRSLFKNTKAEIHDGPKLTYESSKWLWIAGLTFHYCFLIIVIRHMRLFTNPMPFFIEPLEYLDGFLQVTVPALYITDLLFVGAVTFLFVRRLVNPQVRYISFAADYFPLFLILAIATTGILMRYVIRVDIVGIKELTMNLATFSFAAPPANLGSTFFIHLFLICALMAYFPFSKLMHLGGVFLSPTRNMPNDSRMVRHINPWNDPNIKPHSYAGYEDEFREFMAGAGLPLEKELPPEEPEEPAEAEETAAEGEAAQETPAE